MYGVESRFKMQLLLGLKGSPLVGARILNFVTPEKKLEQAKQEYLNVLTFFASAKDRKADDFFGIWDELFTNVVTVFTNGAR